VGRHHFFFKSDPMPKKDAKNERGPTGGHVHYCPAGEVDGSDFRGRIRYAIHPAIDSPNHVRYWEVDREHPDRDENEHRRKFHSLRNRADDQCRRNDREHELIHGEDILRNPIGIIAVRLRIDPAKKREFEAAKKRRPM
jgi:hypothetical protein